MGMPDKYWHELYNAAPFNYTYTFVYSDEQLDWFAEWLAQEYSETYTDIPMHIERIRNAADDGCHGLTYWQGYDFPALIYIPVSRHFNPGAQRVGGMVSFMNTLAHEVAHMGLNICHSIGYDPVREQEPFAYLVGRITQHALKEVPFHMPDLKELVEGAAGVQVEHNIMETTNE